MTSPGRLPLSMRKAMRTRKKERKDSNLNYLLSLNQEPSWKTQLSSIMGQTMKLKEFRPHRAKVNKIK